MISIALSNPSSYDLYIDIVEKIQGVSFDSIVFDPELHSHKNTSENACEGKKTASLGGVSLDPHIHSVPFDPNYRPRGDDLFALVYEFSPHMARLPKWSLKRHHEAMEILLANLYVNCKTLPDFYIAIDRTNGHYPTSAVNNASDACAELFKEATDTLRQFDLLEFVEHVFISKYSKHNRISRIRPSQKLLERFATVKDGGVEWHPEREVIYLKDADKELALYGKYKKDVEHDPPAVVGMRRRLQQYNALLRKTDITLPWSEEEMATLNKHRANLGRRVIDPRACEMYRIFNESFVGGGRFYAPWWAQLDSEDRAKIKINGDPVVELDFSAYHPSLLYLRELGTLPEGDVYALPLLGEMMPEVSSSELRKVIKKAFLVLLNADTRTQAKQALRDVGRTYEEFEVLRTVDLDMLFDSIAERHPAIWKYFGAGMGKRLQNWDSKVADRVMEIMMLKHGVPCLPVHDSFIVPEQHEETLFEAMKAAVKRCGWSECPKIDRK
ncbi:hypothetical protein SAMN02745161_1170 [Halodesulfovibrio marinisediminis DSM 17456]|uniref:DNA polymerase I n=2 Tax=Halodesulfovibrio marinisediminis TaxID=458711 RepID=A0A1N6F8Q2_9BACT|nr:hypothetical protein SAMN02745161_1170 [Halodesulfovibrio marinisediminis DSM 17456]